MATEAIAEPPGLLDGHGLDSEIEDDTDLLKLKPPRPPRPKKVKVKEEDIPEPVRPLTDPLYEEEIIEGFSFCSFNTYEDLEVRQFLYTTCSPNVLQKVELLTKIYLYKSSSSTYLIST